MARLAPCIVYSFLEGQIRVDEAAAKEHGYIESRCRHHCIRIQCLRWHVVVTLGINIPHRTIADDVCNGYYIPKGTVIVTNAWGLSRDTEEYSDPDEFKPERFLDPNRRDPMAYVFGNGRRICAGRHFADTFVFIIVASVLHTLNIERPFDANEKPVRSHRSYPEPFKCRITPRSSQAEALINL
ncbi:hypothetical protein BN946_scf184794.g7 [Trametes cinnabarina]|uniref:Cytochrome P450 n=1 Tax=Pycnoporus cinnabarinus TaxID=5643 RepID=A0A060SLC2_PYCCI|nr:hypothetical protein BN946_scf184794.g7 [Trametes cinnabarina]